MTTIRELTVNETVQAADDANTELICEQLVSESAALKITTDGVIRGVHLVGLQAKNTIKPNKTPYRYTEEALKTAVALYNGVDIYIDHGTENKPRNVLDKVGVVHNAVYKEATLPDKSDAGLYGDIQFNTAHPAYEAVKWWVTHHPQKLGMSHVARTYYDAKENAMTAVVKVFSVDLVTEGSTTHNGLTSVREGVIVDKITKDKWLGVLLDSAWDLMYRIKWDDVCTTEKMLTQEERALKMIPVVEDLAAELAKFAGNVKAKESTAALAAQHPAKDQGKKDKTMEYTDITIEGLQKHRADLVSAVAEAAVAEHIRVEKAVESAVAALPEDFRTDTFKTLVREAVEKNDDKRVAELVEDRKVLAAKTTNVAESAQQQRFVFRKPVENTTAAPDTKSIVAAAKKK